jgi:hypothetical protein
MAASSAAPLSVRVRRCPPFDRVQLDASNDTSREAQSPLRLSHVTTDALVGRALLERHGGASAPQRVDLEYVPLVCFGRSKGIESFAPKGEAGRPRIGRFTILATAWTLHEGIELRLRKRLCGGREAGVPADALPWAILSTEAPAAWPGWTGTAAEATVHLQRTPPAGQAMQVLQIPCTAVRARTPVCLAAADVPAFESLPRKIPPRTIGTALVCPMCRPSEPVARSSRSSRALPAKTRSDRQDSRTSVQSQGRSDRCAFPTVLPAVVADRPAGRRCRPPARRC